MKNKIDINLVRQFKNSLEDVKLGRVRKLKLLRSERTPGRIKSSKS